MSLTEITEEQLQILGNKGLYPEFKRNEMVPCGNSQYIACSKISAFRELTIEALSKPSQFLSSLKDADSFTIIDYFQFSSDKHLESPPVYASVLTWQMKDGKDMSFTEYAGHQ